MYRIIINLFYDLQKKIQRSGNALSMIMFPVDMSH